MPQVFQVLQCYKCKFFQGQTVKKKPKWECKMCSEKQSVKKIFLKTENGKECREYVQELNFTHQNLHNNFNDDANASSQFYNKENIEKEENNLCDGEGNLINVEHQQVTESRWTEFLKNEDKSEHLEVNTSFEYDNKKINDRSKVNVLKKSMFESDNENIDFNI